MHRDHTAPAESGPQVVITSSAPRPHGAGKVRAPGGEDIERPAILRHPQCSGSRCDDIKRSATSRHRQSSGPRVVKTSIAPQPHGTRKVRAPVGRDIEPSTT